MSTNDKDQVTSDGAVELDESELNEATGGVKFTTSVDVSKPKTFEAWPSKWKVDGFDGKGDDAAVELVKGTTAKIYPKIE